MQITLTNTGKRYNREWIFRHLDYEFMPGKSYAITGPNGSGKSTLLQVIGGALLHSEGKIKYNDTGYRMPDAGYEKVGGKAPPIPVSHPISSLTNTSPLQPPTWN